MHASGLASQVKWSRLENRVSRKDLTGVVIGYVQIATEETRQKKLL